MGIEEEIKNACIPDELRRYKDKKIISQIYLVNDSRNIAEEDPLNESITITELEDHVEVFRYNLDYPKDILKSYYAAVKHGARKFKLQTLTYFGIIPKKEYYDLFNFLEQKKVWEINLHQCALDDSINRLLVSKDQREHIIETDSIYHLLLLEMCEELFRCGIKYKCPEFKKDKMDASLNFLDISNEIYFVSKKHAKNKV